MNYTYYVSINKEPKRGDEFRYSYAQTKDIVVSVGKAGAKIITTIGKDYSSKWDGSYAQQLIQDGIKRCTLIYTLKYGKLLPIRSVIITIFKGATEIISIDVTKKTEMYSLIENNIRNPIASNLLGKDGLSAIVGEMKKDYGNRTAALYAYLLSKTKTYEAEKFVYLWMAFNGVYGYWGQKEGIQNNDKAAIEILLKKYGWGKSILSRANREKVGKKVSLIINSYETAITRENVESPNIIGLQQKVFSLPEMKNTDISLYGFLLCDFCYYLRCAMIHANKPLPLFSFENEMDLHVLNTANNLLEDFLNNHLYECFEERD